MDEHFFTSLGYSSLPKNLTSSAESNVENSNDKKKLDKNATNEKTTALTNEFQPNHSYRVIDADLESMRDYLADSYKLFQRIADRFQNINFQGLKGRIKDLTLNNQSDDMLKKVVNDIKKDFDQSYIENRISDLTKKIESKFGLYSKTFTDIPELNEFLRTCTQLHTGLEQLQRRRNDVNDLTKRMTLAANTSFDRIEEIQNILNKRLPSKLNQSIQNNFINNDDAAKNKNS